MAFEWEYPIFFVARTATTDLSAPLNISFHDIVTLSDPNAPTGFAVFTDRPGAEEFRDRYAPGYEVYELPTEGSFAAVLHQVKRIAKVVAFDAFRLGYQITAIPIDDLLPP